MKVPKMYKSSDRYNAGTDVIYDDESKLQYAPFIYATAESGDSGGGGDDEEGEDTMLVTFDPETSAIDKSFKELKEAVNGGKIVFIPAVDEDDAITVFYLVVLDTSIDVGYTATFASVYHDDALDENQVQTLVFVSATDTDNMAIEDIG